MKKVTDIVAALAEPVVKKHGCELWDVEYVREAGSWFLRVYIDRDDGVTLEQCEAVSRELDPILDARDPIPDSYTFEVSSAGAERQLKRPSDFQRFLGHLVEVRLYKALDGRKEYVGTLTAAGDDYVEIGIAGTAYQFAKPDIANVRLRIGPQ
jgi:ribosome maturation factor RimP